MHMILCDWTRMGRAYCLAGAVETKAGWAFVRPILHKPGGDAVRNVGWSAYLLDGHFRWEIFELIGCVVPPSEPPHVEDVWVRALKPLKQTATITQRRAILEAGRRPDTELLFGAPFHATQSALSLQRGTGDRSLVTVVVDRRRLTFSGAMQHGRAAPSYRVTLDVPGLGSRSLPIVDHFLLRASELAGNDTSIQLRELERIIGQMGERIAVRCGVTRPFAATSSSSPTAAVCWVMADGFFSLDDPQP